MASNDSRNSPNNDNMLQFLTRAAHYEFSYKNVLHKIKPVLSTVSTNHNFHTTSAPQSKYAQDFPKYPVPKLQDTLQKYLRSIMPLVTPEELQKTKCLVEQFGERDGCGEALQKILEKKGKCSQNWLAQWWLETAYLGYRQPVVVHSSPGQLMLPFLKFCDPDDRLEFAAKVIITALKYKKLIDKEQLPQEKMGKDNLDMGQYKVLFGTCRVPKPELDKLQYNPKSKHIVVAVNNNFFKLTPYDNCGKMLNVYQLKCQLKCIMQLSCERAPAVGILSSDQRDAWANNYKHLIKDAQNQCSVSTIQQSMFLLCLDGKMPKCNEEDRLTFAGHHTIHGFGSTLYGGNRWFDKTVQFIVTEDGVLGLTYEHSPAEGQPVAMMVDYVLSNVSKVECGNEAGESEPVKKLEFIVDCDLENEIKKASKSLDKLVCDLEMRCGVLKDFGKNFIKSQKVSPDSFIQMAMQLAYYRMYCRPAAHYESAGCRRYKNGRTETIRSCSVESVKFAQAMLDDSLKPMDKRHLLEAAINSHKKYTVDAVMGYGVDRHFLGLKKIAAEYDVKLHPMFTDVSFTRSTHFHITSSQVATKAPGFMCYGAVVSDGYGICYNPRNDDIYYAISCFKQEPSTDVRRMEQALLLSFRDMHDVLVKAPKSKG